MDIRVFQASWTEVLFQHGRKFLGGLFKRQIYGKSFQELLTNIIVFWILSYFVC